MTLLNWIKNQNRTNSLLLSQINGITGILLVALAFYFVSDATYWQHPKALTVPFSEKTEGTVTIELAGAVMHQGIYHYPANETVSSFLDRIGIKPEPAFSKPQTGRALSDGRVIYIDTNNRVILKEMTSIKRLAVDLRVDVNKATYEDLVCIPGIKQVTANKILEFRHSQGGRISRVEDLSRIRGIKDKKIQQLRKYLFVSEEA